MKKTTIGALLLLSLVTVEAGELDRARELIGDGQYDAARPLAERAASSPATRGEGLVLLTRIAVDQGDWKTAVTHGKEAIKLLPGNSEAHLRYAEALRIRLQNISRVKAVFQVGGYKAELRKALELDPDSIPARTEEIGWLTFAPGVAGGDRKKARRLIEELESLDWRESRLMLAELELAEENDEAALAAWKAILERQPDDIPTHLRVAFWYQGKERFDEADGHFLAALAGDHPRHSLGALYQRARSRILGEYEQQAAVEFLIEYIGKIDDNPPQLPGKSAAYWRLGNAYEQLGEVADARQAYNRALSIDGENKEARKALKALPRG